MFLNFGKIFTAKIGDKCVTISKIIVYTKLNGRLVEKKQFLANFTQHFAKFVR